MLQRHREHLDEIIFNRHQLKRATKLLKRLAVIYFKSNYHSAEIEEYQKLVKELLRIDKIR